MLNCVLFVRAFALLILLGAVCGGAELKGTIADAKTAAKSGKDGKPVFVAQEGKVYTISNAERAQGHVGHKVVIQGKLDGDIIHITKIEREEGGKKGGTSGREELDK
jgi:hypothetical protein